MVFKSGNPGLVSAKQLIHYSFIITKQCIKYLKYKLNRINKTYQHSIRTSDYSSSISSCHVLTSHVPSNKISPYSILELPLLSSRIFYPPPHSPKNLQTPINWRQKIGEKAYVQIRLPHSLMVKLSSSTRGSWSLTNQTLKWLSWLI